MKVAWMNRTDTGWWHAAVDVRCGFLWLKKRRIFLASPDGVWWWDLPNLETVAMAGSRLDELLCNHRRMLNNAKRAVDRRASFHGVSPEVAAPLTLGR